MSNARKSHRLRSGETPGPVVTLDEIQHYRPASWESHFPRPQCYSCVSRWLDMIMEVTGGHFKMRETDKAIGQQVFISLAMVGWINKR